MRYLVFMFFSLFMLLSPWITFILPTSSLLHAIIISYFGKRNIGKVRLSSRSWIVVFTFITENINYQAVSLSWYHLSFPSFSLITDACDTLLAHIKLSRQVTTCVKLAKVHKPFMYKSVKCVNNITIIHMF